MNENENTAPAGQAVGVSDVRCVAPVVGPLAEPRPVTLHAVVNVDGLIHVHGYADIACGAPFGEPFQRGYFEVGRWMMAPLAACSLAENIAANLPPETASALAQAILANARRQAEMNTAHALSAARGMN